MLHIIENWMPLDQFEQVYPEYRHSYYIKINEYILFYEITSIRPDAQLKKSVYFSLEDAFSGMQEKKH